MTPRLLSSRPKLRAISSLEALEARIAPAAAVLLNPLLDIVGGAGKSTASIDLSKMFDATVTGTSRTHVKFITNVDMDAGTPGIQGGVIEIELYDDLAPLSVQNFLEYVKAGAKGGYDNTFFHRSFDFQSTTVEDNDIIQGGGFAFPKVSEHIPTGPTVHNEFSASLPNIRGTLAMAKIGGDPNSASSEWFFNVHDNTSILGGANNGGFAVFGAVTSESLAVIDRISDLTTFSAGGFSDLPLQNYNANPDNNVNTPPPAITADNYIRILDAQIVSGSATGFTYSAQVTEHNAPGTPSNLLKASVKGATLDLKFSGNAGLADVIVTGRNAAGEPTTDTFTVRLGPNLLASYGTDAFASVIVPGDASTLGVNITNSGSANLKTSVKVEYYLSKIMGAETSGTEVSPDDLLLGTLTSRAISLAPGKSVTIPQKLMIPTDLTQTPGDTYRILAKVTPLSAVDQLNDFTDDDTARLSGQHRLFNAFGSFAGRTGVALKYVQDDGNPTTVDPVVTLTMKGAGVGQLTIDGDGKIDLLVESSDAKSKFLASVGKGGVAAEFDDVSFSSTIGSVDFSAANLSGFGAFSGGLQTLKIGNLNGPGGLTIGALLPANTTKAAITLGRVHDYTLESSMPIGSLTAVEWLETTGSEEALSLLALDKLTITGAKGGPRGDLQASVNIAASTPVGSITIAGLLNAATITTAGDIGSVTIGGMNESNIFAGTLARPALLTDFFADRIISKFTIKGIAGFTGDLFAGSQVAAQEFGTISVQKVDPTNGAVPFGFVADVIKSYNRVGGAKLSKLEDPATLDTAGDYRLVIL